MFSTARCGLSWDHRWELRVLIPLRVEVASSVNSINRSNWRLVCNKWQNSRRMALPPGCSFCTRCGWNGHKPSSDNVRHTRVRETQRRVESLRVLLVGPRCTVSRMFSCSYTCCWCARSDETWALGSVPGSRNVLTTLESTLRSAILRVGNRR
jgi:hypothetical protein